MAFLEMDWPFLGSTVGKIGLAYLLTLPIGWWREREMHAVGIRTFPIVAIASCGYLLIFQGSPDAQTLNSRVLQGLMAGIGFVGGGAIVLAALNLFTVFALVPVKRKLDGKPRPWENEKDQ